MNLGQPPSVPALVIKDPGGEMLLTLGYDDLALIGKWLLAQARAWEAGR